MNRSFVLATTILLLLPALGLAQEEAAPSDPPAPDPTAAFLAGLEGLDETLCETREWVIRFRGQHIGSAKLVVAPAAEGSRAVYEVRFEAEMKSGAESFSGSETTLLDEKLAVVSSHVWRRETRGIETVDRTNSLRREGDATWVFTRTIGEETTTLRQEFDGMVHSGTAPEFLLVKKLVGRGAGTYSLRGIDWPDEDAEESDEPAVRELRVWVSPVPDSLGSGDDVESWKADVTRVDGSVKQFELSLDGEIERFGPEGSPVEFVSASYAPPPPPRAETPSAAVILYLRVLTGGVPVSALDGFMDWAALKEWIKPDPGLTLPAFAATLKQQFASKAGAITEAQVAAIAPLLGVSEKDGQATVHLPGQEENPFLLKKKGDGWYIVRFPR